VLVTGFPSAVFSTNCFVVAPGVGEECVVVDPGIEVTDSLAEILAEQRLRPAAVLLTHGHIDHVYSVTPVCGAHGVAAYVHGDDRYRLTDPLQSLDRGLIEMLEQEFGRSGAWTEPEEILALTDGQHLEIAGLTLGVVHAPGHTEGSVMFTLPGAPEGVEVSSTLLSGDVLFAGSIGRTDMPGGDIRAMMRSLREKVLTLDDDTLVLPGHGPATTVARERATNPYLVEAAHSG
jgi:glyoxylase-like metal-dependent hydrolase (beta-lactamase superfamily II)